jgi:hypothetical protein
LETRDSLLAARRFLWAREAGSDSGWVCEGNQF